ncbi:leishmanolysin-related zinc metalloendopeptidase, partial [Novipirellula rosea]
SAGPTAIGVDSSGFTLATDGLMRFDSADIGGLSESQIDSLILHEMAHVLGFGTLWTSNNVYVNGSGEFTGANATAAWQSEFGQAGTPDVELGGGSGTANGHWNEPDGGGALSGITDAMGRDLTFELMTGWLNTGSFISEMTVASFRDIGFSAQATSVPEPAAAGWMSAVTMVIVGVRRRQRRLRAM